MSANLIELQEVSKIYRMGQVQVAALDGICLQIREASS
jgi:ABC-type lipoprotein export system ATPase subunit